MLLLVSIVQWSEPATCIYISGASGDSVVKISRRKCRRHGFDPSVRKILLRGGNVATHSSILSRKSMERVILAAYNFGVAKSWTCTGHTHTHTCIPFLLGSPSYPPSSHPLGHHKEHRAELPTIQPVSYLFYTWKFESFSFPGMGCLFWIEDD